MMKFPLLFALVILLNAQTQTTAEESPAPQALVMIRVLEMDLAKVRKLEVELRTPDASSPLKAEPLLKTQVIAKNDPVRGLIRACEKQQMATVLAETNQSVTLERPAHFTSGGEFPVPSGQDGKEVIWRRYGTEAESTVGERGENRVAVSFKLRLSEIDKSREITVADTKVPGLAVFEAATTFESNWDDTLMLCQPVADNTGQKRELMRIVLVTPSRLDAVAAAKPGKPKPRTSAEPQLK